MKILWFVWVVVVGSASGYTVGTIVTPKILPPKASAAVVVSGDMLRCTNGITAKAWDRVAAEGYMLRAQVAAETASRWVGVPAMKLAWATESLAWSAIVRECWE